jgi:hypothetical protein
LSPSTTIPREFRQSTLVWPPIGTRFLRFCKVPSTEKKEREKQRFSRGITTNFQRKQNRKPKKIKKKQNQ